MLKLGAQMVKQMNEISKEVDNLFDEIESSKLYNDYKEVLKQLNSNTEIKEMLDEIRRLQKIAVNTKDKKIDIELKELYKKLDSYPLYQSYLSIKEELEEQLQNISFTLNSYFKDILDITKQKYFVFVLHLFFTKYLKT